MKQWIVGRELRKRLTQAFKDHSIEMPRPTMHLYVEKIESDSQRTDAATNFQLPMIRLFGSWVGVG
jgi:small-conductance mechanosensitive channel